MCVLLQVYLHSFPQLEGRTFGELAAYFPAGLPFGLLRGQEVLMNPDREQRVQAADEIMLIRPTNTAPHDFQPAPRPVQTDLGERCSRMPGTRMHVQSGT